MYKLFLTLRYLRKGRIAYFAIGAVTLCVAMVLIVMSVMGGWLDMVKQRARGLLGDVIVDNRDYSGFPLYQQFIDQISQWPEIVKATPVIYTEGLLHVRDPDMTAKINVIGIRLQDVYQVNAFKEGLFYEKYYLGTTHLGEQQQPFLGIDPDADPVPVNENGGTSVYAQPKLPDDLRAAWAKAREAAAARGEELDPTTEEIDTATDDLLRKIGRPPLPGMFAFKAGNPVAEYRGNPLPGLIFGRDLIAKRHSDGRYTRYIPRGHLATVAVWAASITGDVDVLDTQRQPFRYADDSRTGIYEIDSQHVYCDFGLLQKLLLMDPAERVDAQGNPNGTAPARCSQIQIKIADGANARELCERMTKLYQGMADSDRFDLDYIERGLVLRVEAMTWEQSQAHIIGPVEKERVLVTTLFGIISLVAVALVLCILYMIVLQKTRDIGIIKALGASSGGVAMIFVIYGATVGIVASGLGAALGSAFVWNINEVQDLLIQFHPSLRVWDLQVYSFDRIPSDVKTFDVVVVVIAAIFASTLGSFAAAWRAGSMQPVEALRHE